MNLTRRAKILVGILAFWPLVQVIDAIVFVIFGYFGELLLGGTAGYDVVFHIVDLLLSVLVALLYVTIPCFVGLIVFFVLYILRTDRVCQEKKLQWIINLVVAGVFTLPLFWYFYIWREPTQKSYVVISGSRSR